MTTLRELIPSIRDQFPALKRTVSGRAAVYFDGPAGTQVPQSVIDAIADYLSNRNANHEGCFVTSRESDAMLAEAHRAAADLLGASDPDCVYFGPNMTTLTLALSRSISTRWKHGDEIMVTRMDHDANVSPWVLAAKDAGAQVRYVNLRPGDCTLDMDSLRRQLTSRTRLVAVGCASNATGTINPISEVVQCAHAVGALVFLDAVHYAPHASVDVAAWDCDFLACSAYKFYGPHIGIMFGRRELLEELPAYKLRPVPEDLPGKWMSGTQNHECLAGTLAAINYLAQLGSRGGANHDANRRERLVQAFRAIGEYEQELLRQLLDGLRSNSAIKVWGVTDAGRMRERLPTVAFTHQRLTASEVATRLGQAGIFAWHGNYYALELTESLGLEPEGMVRIGLVHYNTPEEVEYLLNQLATL